MYSISSSDSSFKPNSTLSHVSVIIPAYNSARFLPEAIESVLKQTHPVFEIVVVDDGSTDNTKEVCQNYPTIKYIYQKNQGVSAARNTGISASTGEYLLFLDSDDCIYPEAVEIGLNYIDCRPEVGFVFGRVKYLSINPDGTYTLEETYENQPEVANYATLLACEHEIQCGCIIFRRAAVESVGGFDSTLQYMEDINLFLKVARDFPIYFHNQIVSEYRVTGKNVSRNSAKMLIGALNAHSLQLLYIAKTGNEVYKAAYERGKAFWLKLFLERLPYEIMKCAQSGRWIEALGNLRLLLNYDPKLQYVDPEIYAVSYKTLLSKLRQLPIESSLAYWKQQLAGAPPLLSLPTDRPRPAEQNFRGASQSFVISQKLTTALSRLSKQQGVTLFMTLLAAYDTLLYRYTGIEDIILGSPIATNINSQIFVNAVAIRTNMSGNPSFQQLLKQVRELTLLAKTYQELPDCLLIDELCPQPDPSYPPLFQVTFVFEEDISLQNLNISTLTASPWVLENNQGKYDLTLFFKEINDELQGQWVYNTDLFESESIERLNSNFQTLLRGIVANPEKSISELPLLTAKEKEKLLIEWNNTTTYYPSDKLIHQLIAEQVEKNPEALAVVFEGQQITYRELNSKANQLAHYLRSLGVGTEAIVGIFLEKSLDLIVTVLGIFKSGAAYLPLDSSYPSDRLEFMLADAQPSVIITTSPLQANLPHHTAQVICLDSDRQTLTQNPLENPINQTHPHNLAYIIYTSGSTGKPKGVMIEQRSLVNAYLGWEDAYRLTTETSNHLQMASFSFDVFAGDFVRALCSGAKLVLCPRDLLLESKQLYSLMRQEKVDCAEFVPAVLRNLVEYLERTKQNLGFMKVLAAGSDSWYLSEYKQIRSLCGSQTRLINSYGVSEATIDSTYFETDVVDLSDDRLIPIGRPFPNTEIYILDQQLQLVPIGVPGELHIGGVGLARGYLNRPDLTDAKFISNPFQRDRVVETQSSHLERLYKTGDLVRYLQDGNIEFVGRIDYQVKIRGFRIELGEIEALLTQYPEIREASVIVREDVPGDKRLVAYIVSHQEQTPKINHLRDFLCQHLPNFMIPSAFVTLDALPMTPNGKINRRALLTYSQPNNFIFADTRSQTANSKADSSTLTKANPLDTSFLAPRTPTEEILLGIWKQVLGLDTVSIHDNFFELGGHSLIAAKMIGYCYQAFSQELLLRDLFKAPTVAALAVVIDNSQKQQDGASVSQRILHKTNRKSAPLSFAQQRLWFLEQLEPNRTDYYMASALSLKGFLNIVALQKSLDAIVARHEVLRTNYIAKDGEPIQVISPPRPLKLQIFDLQHYSPTEQAKEVTRLLQQESDRSFNLSQDLMLRVSLLQISPQEHILLWVMHHIASDGWSINIFSQQLSQLYTAFLNNQPNPLPPMPLQYADFAEWQRQWLTGEELNKQLQYWKQQLANTDTILELPTDHPRPAIQTSNGGTQSWVLGENLTTALKHLCLQEKVTLYMTMLAAFAALLSRYNGQEDILVGSPIAGRQKTELENMIGFFVSTLVLRIDLSGNPTFEELLNRTSEVALDAYNHQDLPFEKLVEELKVKRDLSRNPLFQVWFNMINLEDSDLEFSGLVVEPISLPETNSKFDITLYVQEKQGEIHLKSIYNKDLFKGERITEMLYQFEHFLTQIVAQPNSAIQSYSLVTPKSQALLPNPSIIIPEPHHEPITNIFTNWATRTPQQPAIIQDSRTWTYSQLAEAAQIIAQTLLVTNIQRGDVVAVSGSRSFGLIASMLGVMMSGGVLLTIDPNLPEARQQLMLTSSKAQRLLCVDSQKLTTNFIAKSLQIITINPDTGKPTIESEILDYTPVVLSPEDAAYIFFTSGTTGIPKGVLGSHKGLAHFLNWQRQTFDIVPQDRVGQLTGLSFDVVLRDIFLPLTSGATLCLPNAEDNLSSARILPWLERQQISLLHTVPSLAQSWLIDVPPGVSLQSLRLLFFAGEPLTDTLIESWRSAFPKSGEIVNLYGPTETTLAKCYYQIPATPLPGVQPISSPLPETQALVFTANHQLCGIGESGEIVIRTPFRTKGYINSDEQKSRFVKNPFSEDEQDLLYYTGDRGRYRLDGTLEILGRIDQQVKIRGVRIEPGEIAAVLNQNPNINASIVIAREDIPKDKRLVAYVVPHPEQTPTSSEIRQFLKQHLPDYMIPAAFVMLEALPLTPNGKIDRRALPVPEYSKLNSEGLLFVAPRNQLETQLTQIWEAVLGVKPIGITDNFFELGGHSLIAVRLFVEIEKLCGKNLPLATLFQAQTIEELADVIGQDGWSAPWSSLVQIQPGNSQPPLFCVHPIGGNVLEYYKLAHYIGQDQPVYGLQALGLDGKQAPLTTIEDMAHHYIQEIKTIQPHGPYFLAGHSFAGMVVFEMAQQLHKQGENVALLALLDRKCPKMPKIHPSLLKYIQIHWNNLWQLDSKGRLKYVMERFKYKYVHKGDYREFMIDQWTESLAAEYINVLDANLQAIDNYRPQVYPEKITLFRCQVQPVDQALHHDLGWSELVTGEIEIHHIPGDHFGLLREPHVQVLAKKLKSCLKRLQSDSKQKLTKQAITSIWR